MGQNAVLATDACLTHLSRLGEQIRARRKALGVNATNTAESAGISRVTLHRIEKGEPSVAMGAYLNVLSSLGLMLPDADTAVAKKNGGSIPTKIRLVDFPQLRQLAWQVHGTDSLTPIEARDIYERNWRHLDLAKLDDTERQLINALQTGLGGDFPHV
jgi:transcriptional regulator with XRE-family HTH domain